MDSVHAQLTREGGSHKYRPVIKLQLLYLHCMVALQIWLARSKNDDTLERPHRTLQLFHISLIPKENSTFHPLGFFTFSVIACLWISLHISRSSICHIIRSRKDSSLGWCMSTHFQRFIIGNTRWSSTFSNWLSQDKFAKHHLR